jgi:hypothetical protein
MWIRVLKALSNGWWNKIFHASPRIHTLNNRDKMIFIKFSLLILKKRNVQKPIKQKRFCSLPYLVSHLILHRF